MGRSVRMPISTKNYKNNDSITVFLQPACSCEFKEIEKYGDDMIRNLGSSWDGVYPYPCIIDWNGESHNFYRAASEVKEAIEEVEKKQKK